MNFFHPEVQYVTRMCTMMLSLSNEWTEKFWGIFPVFFFCSAPLYLFVTFLMEANNKDIVFARVENKMAGFLAFRDI